jgi:transcriptional regulator with GAF, ATPase, and Fis domain
MKLDEHEFFREATLRICGNLEIEEALFSSFQFLREVMPVDMVFLQFFEVDQRAFHTVANATDKEGKIIDMLVPLSPEAFQEMMVYVNEYLNGHKPNHVWLFADNPHEQSFTDEIYDFHGERITSLMVMPLEVQDKVLGGGSLWLSTRGDRKFSQKHADLLSLLKEPFALAMSNALKHRNELNLYGKEFFWEATKRLCGNLEIEKGLQACLEHIAKYMPADAIYLQKYEIELGAMRLVVRASAEKGERMNVLLPLSEEAKAAVIQLRQSWMNGTAKPVFMINRPGTEPISQGLFDELGMPFSSVMVLPLVVEEQVAGSVALVAEGIDRFDDYHAQLYSTLKEPFFVAMSNTLKHREVLKLKDMLADDNRYLHGELHRLSGDEIVGADFGLRDVMHKVHQVASLDSPVLLLGETGVGKDVIANTIHYSSSRSSGPFVSVNCGAIPDTLLDSELFGHEKGAFTGALSQKRGRFERADNGTIFLDEIGELPPQAQVRLLRVLQSREIERVGGIKTIPLNIRIIAATNRNLEEMVKQRKFREDLWFRLNVFPIWIPPLRDRNVDIPALLQHFITMKSKVLNMPAIPELAPGAIDLLMQYHWPGNVRELENIVERAIILNPQGPLTFDDLIQSQQEKKPALSEQHSESNELDHVISRHIQNVLHKTEGRVHGPDGAAEQLGINPSTLRARMNKLGINYGRGSRN